MKFMKFGILDIRMDLNDYLFLQFLVLAFVFFFNFIFSGPWSHLLGTNMSENSTLKRMECHLKQIILLKIHHLYLSHWRKPKSKGWVHQICCPINCYMIVNKTWYQTSFSILARLKQQKGTLILIAIIMVLLAIHRVTILC